MCDNTDGVVLVSPLISMFRLASGLSLIDSKMAAGESAKISLSLREN